MKSAISVSIGVLILTAIGCASPNKSDKSISEINSEAKELCKKIRTGTPSEETRQLKSAAPKYPRNAAIDGVNGCVFVKFDISEKGVPMNLSVIEATPGGYGFQEAAKSAVLNYRYEKKPVTNKVVRVEFQVN